MENDDPTPPGRVGIADLLRRRVIRTGLVYAAGAWVALQFADVVFPLLGLPQGANRWVLGVLIGGFLLAMVVSWLLEVREERGEAPIRWMSGSGAALVVILIGIAVATSWVADPLQPDGSELPTGLSLAVIPFSDTDSPGDGVRLGLGQELSHDIRVALSRFGKVTVYAPTREATDEEPLKIGRDLSAEYVLSGRVRRDGARIRVVAELESTSSGALIWSQTYDRDLSNRDVFGIESEIADRVAATLADRTGVLARSAYRAAIARSSVDFSADECVLLADHYFEAHTDEQHGIARDCLEKAVKREPNHAEAWANLAYLYREEFLHRRNERVDSLGRARVAAQRAIELDPTSPMAHFAYAVTLFSSGDLSAARAEGRRAIELNANDATILGVLATTLALAGEWDEAIAIAKRATDLNPAHPVIMHNVFAMNHYRLGEYEQALAAHQRISHLDTMRSVTRAAILAQLGQTEQARAVLEPVLMNDKQFAADPIAELRRIYLEDEFIESLAVGLRMAGLDTERHEVAPPSNGSYTTRSRGRRSTRQKR